MIQTIYRPETMTIDPIAYEAGSQYAEAIADGFAGASFDAAMLSTCAYSFYAGLDAAMKLVWTVGSEETPERKDEDREEQGQDTGEREQQEETPKGVER